MSRQGHTSGEAARTDRGRAIYLHMAEPPPRGRCMGIAGTCARVAGALVAVFDEQWYGCIKLSGIWAFCRWCRCSFASGKCSRCIGSPSTDHTDVDVRLCGHDLRHCATFLTSAVADRCVLSCECTEELRSIPCVSCLLALEVTACRIRRRGFPALCL